MKKLLKENKGFTLIELMVVIVIIAILAAIALPTFSGMLNDAKDAQATAEARSVYTLAQMYVNAAEAGATSVSTGDLQINDPSGFSEILTDAGVPNANVGILVGSGNSIVVNYYSDSGNVVTIENGMVTVTTP